jgi:hypothetical protein
MMEKSKLSNKNFQACKIAADESTDAEGVAKISAFILGRDTNFITPEEPLELTRTYITATGEDIARQIT